MCGILFEIDSKLCNEDNFKYALESQHHRGPDGANYRVLNSGKVIIGNNRLAIIDKSGGSQPLASADGLVVITFNGEVFNSRDLRSDLEKIGVEFNSSHSDTEVILQMYLNFGIKFIEQINGMFAIVIVDLKIQQTFVIRDRFGMKPIYFKTDGNRFIFASDLRAIKILSKNNEISQDSVAEFIGMGFISSPDSIYQDIKSLQAACFMKIDMVTGKSYVNNWWTPPVDEYSDITFKESVNLVHKEFTNAVSRWTTSDYPIAISLSGGVDSSSILIACLEGKIKVNPFFMGFEDKNLSHWDESNVVKSFTDVLGISFNYSEITSQDLIYNLSNIASHLEQPYGGGIPSWKIFSEMKKSGYRVALNGTGGDELFGNYNRAINLPLNVFDDMESFKLNYLNNFYKIYPYEVNELFMDNVSERFIDKLFQKAQRYQTLKLAKRSALFDIETQLTDEFLIMIDKLSMMHSIEARTPFLDHVFFEEIHRIPDSIKNIKGSYKLLLKNAFGDALPVFLKDAPKKGFSLPLSIWFRGELQEILISRILDEEFIGYFHLNKLIVSQALDQFLSGDNSRILFIWRLFMLSFWLSSVEMT
jgi:asparagine synthase (glutamine-hydrolysing)